MSAMSPLRTVICVALLCLPAFGASRPAYPKGASPAGQTSSSATPAKKKKSKKKTHSRREPSQTAPDSTRISEIQTALSRGGYYHGDPTGKWDSDTIAAMQKFQSSNGLDATGKLDALSLQKLGLGSEIAGVSAPKPVVHVSVTPSSTPSTQVAPVSPTSPASTSPAPTAAPSTNTSGAASSVSPSATN